MNTQFVGFRATISQRQKLEALAAGERKTMSRIIAKLIDDAEVVPTQPILKPSLKFATNKKNGVGAVTESGPDAAVMHP